MNPCVDRLPYRVQYRSAFPFAFRRIFDTVERYSLWPYTVPPTEYSTDGASEIRVHSPGASSRLHPVPVPSERPPRRRVMLRSASGVPGLSEPSQKLSSN